MIAIVYSANAIRTLLFQSLPFSGSKLTRHFMYTKTIQNMVKTPRAV